jgi:hypothetical protein
MKRHIITLLAATLPFSAPTLAKDTSKLEGTTFFDQETCPKGEKSPNCVFSIEITGANAKILYDGMRAKPDPQGCIPNTKSDASGLECYKDEDGTYSCHFGYDFGKKKFTNSKVDC